MFMFIRISGLCFYVSSFSIEVKEPITFSKNVLFCLVLKTICHGFPVKKNKPVTYLCAKKHTGSKVAACCFCKVAIRNNKLELLDVACNFIKRNSGIGLSCGFEKIFKTNFNETVPGNQFCLLDLEQVDQGDR